MRASLAAPLVAAALLAACGTSTSSCPTAPAAIATVPGCTFPPGTAVTMRVRAACQKCSQSAPSCGATIDGSNIELQPVYSQCTQDAGCATGDACVAAPVLDCQFTTPSTPSVYQVRYPTQAGGNGIAFVTVAPGAGATCGP